MPLTELPTQLNRLPDDRLKILRDALEVTIESGLSSIEDVRDLHACIVAKLTPAEEAATEEEDVDVEIGNASMPFVRFDTTSVPNDIGAGCQIYLKFENSGKVLGISGEDTGSAENEEFDPSMAFVVEKASGDDGGVNDGDQILLRHVGSDKYLEAGTDSKPLSLGDRNEESLVQTFWLCKGRSPKALKHRDQIFLQSWLSNFVGQEDTKVIARRWQRGVEQSIIAFKRDVVEATTTELARKMQFQSFDLDGNQTISKIEMKYMLKKVKEANPVSDEELDGIMGALDPNGIGKIPLPAFAAWADNGGLAEDVLQHAEVIGNTALRCSDCTNVQKTLHEVLAALPTHMCAQVVETYETRFGSSLKEALEAKASEQDGWICTNYWKLALTALVEPEVDLWCRALYDAMNGLGTDEGTLTALVCTIPDRLRLAITRRYDETYKKPLVKHIKSETSFSYKKVLELQAMVPEDCWARMLNQAMVGLGTNEDQLIRVICQLDFGERRACKEAYFKLYQRDLVPHIESETSGRLKQCLVALLTAEEAEFDLEADCAAMKAAMDGWGTDENTLVKLVCSKTNQQMVEINKKFEELYDKQLFKRVESETSGHLQTILLSQIRHPMHRLAYAVRACIKGWGTDDTGLICLLVHLPEFKKEALIKAYQEVHGRDLMKDIKGDTSGSYAKALLSLVKPAATVWAEALTGAMKGLGTSDELLINFMAIAKDSMSQVRKAFKAANGKSLAEWINGDCSGDYKDTLVAVAKRDSENYIDMLPIFWAQRLKDCLDNIKTLSDIFVALPAVSITRGTAIYQEVYGKSLTDDITEKCEAKKGWFCFSNYWLKGILALMEMPVNRYVRCLNDAMAGIGTDEFTLTGLVCTIPPNMNKDIHIKYEETYGKTLVEHIESETSSSYKKVLILQCLSWPKSRAKCIKDSLEAGGDVAEQLIRVIITSTVLERKKIMEAYQEMHDASVIGDIEGKAGDMGDAFVAVMVATLESCEKSIDFDYEDNCNIIEDAMQQRMDDKDQICRIFASKTPEQLQTLCEKWSELKGDSLIEKVANDDGWEGIFADEQFRKAVVGLLRGPTKQLAYSVRDCIKGWGTNETGLITCLVHLSERKRRELIEAYAEIPDGGDLIEAIKGDTSGDFQDALLALVKPSPLVIAEALVGAMKGLGTSDELLINWMCIAKDRMSEVRVAFEEAQGKSLAEWIEGECSADYKELLVRLANRDCMWFPGVEVALQKAAPPSKKRVIEEFNKTFNELCAKKKTSPDDILKLTEDYQQELGSVFQYYGALSTCAPNLDKKGLWDLTNAVGFPPADDGPDLEATFDEWDYSGSGEITWNDFVREMATRINDPNHYNAEPLPETIDCEEILTPSIPSAPPKHGIRPGNRR